MRKACTIRLRRSRFFVRGFASKSTVVPDPTSSQLRLVAFHSAIPFVGFGFIDNLTLITAGDMIDNTLGVALGLSTLYAAGLGQCFSDVAGLTCGGMVDAAVSKLNLRHHNLTMSQMDLRTTRIFRLLGSCVGVVTGCLLGMSCLLFMDTTQADRAKKAKELQSIFESVMDNGATVVGCERATLWMVDEEHNELWSRVATGTKQEIRVERSKGVVGACIASGAIINIPDAYQDDRFNKDVDISTGYRTKTILAVPVKNNAGKVIGAIQAINKLAKEGDASSALFDETDERLISLLASHVSTFTRIVNEA